MPIRLQLQALQTGSTRQRYLQICEALQWPQVCNRVICEREPFDLLAGGHKTGVLDGVLAEVQSNQARARSQIPNLHIDKLFWRILTSSANELGVSQFPTNASSQLASHEKCPLGFMGNTMAVSELSNAYQ